MKLFEVSSVLEDFWALLLRASRRTLRKAFGGEVSAEKRKGRAENGNAPSEFIARRKFFFHTPPNVFSSLSSRSHKQKSPPHGERQLADGGDFFETTDGVSRAARRASEAPSRGTARRAGAVGDVNQEVGGSRPLGDPAAEPACPGLNPARALDVNGKAAVSSPTRGGEPQLAEGEQTVGLPPCRAISRRFSKTLYSACRRSVKPVLLTAQPWLSPRSGRPGTRPEKPGAIWGGSSRYAPRLGADHNESLGSFRSSFPRLSSIDRAPATNRARTAAGDRFVSRPTPE